MSDNGQTQADDISVQGTTQQVQIAIMRLKALSNASEPVDTRVILADLADTILPIMADQNVLIDRLEQHADWATGQLTEGEESQLQPDDAERFRAFITVVVEQAEVSTAQMDPESDTALALSKMAVEGKALLQLIDDIELPDEDDDDEPDGEGEPDIDDADDEPAVGEA